MKVYKVRRKSDGWFLDLSRYDGDLIRSAYTPWGTVFGSELQASDLSEHYNITSVVEIVEFERTTQIHPDGGSQTSLKELRVMS